MMPNAEFMLEQLLDAQVHIEIHKRGGFDRKLPRPKYLEIVDRAVEAAMYRFDHLAALADAMEINSELDWTR